MLSILFFFFFFLKINTRYIFGQTQLNLVHNIDKKKKKKKKKL